MIDPWDPASFSEEIQNLLNKNSELIYDYFSQHLKSQDHHIKNQSYKHLKKDNLEKLYSKLQEETLTPILKNCRIRIWHYTRLTDDEVAKMKRKLVLSSLDYLRLRLNMLISNDLLSDEESDLIFKQSPFHKQAKGRSGMLWGVTIPLPCNDDGVTPLLQSWGGESAYFWLSDQALKLKLNHIGLPRVIEIDTSLTDGVNAFSVSKTVLEAWAKKLGVSVAPLGTDLAIRGCIDTAKVVNVHTQGEISYKTIANTYPKNVQKLLVI